MADAVAVGGAGTPIVIDSLGHLRSVDGPYFLSAECEAGFPTPNCSYSSDADGNEPFDPTLPPVTPILDLAGSLALGADGTLISLRNGYEDYEGVTADRVAGYGSVRCILNGDEVSCAATLHTLDVPASPVPGVTDTIAVSAADDLTCAVDTRGNLTCWGQDFTEQLEGFVDSSGPITIPGVDDAIHVALGDAGVCAVRENDVVTCWGDLSSEADVVVPAIEHIEVGDGYACATNDAGELWCWGDLTDEALAYLAEEDGGEARRLDVGGGVVDFSVRGSTICYVLDSGRANCLGGYLAEDRRSWLESIGEARFISPNRCVMLDDGRTSCGPDDTTNDQLPGRPSGETVDLLYLNYRNCALETSGELYCRATNDEGDAELVYEDVVQVAQGGLHTCYLLADGTVECVGDHTAGQRGTAPYWSSTITPCVVEGLPWHDE